MEGGLAMGASMAPPLNTLFNDYMVAIIAVSWDAHFVLSAVLFDKT